MKNTAAEFIRRAAFVDANALLKGEQVSNTGRFHTDEELAAILRDATGSIQVVMSSACSLSMSKRLSAMTWRQRGMTLMSRLGWP